MSYEIRPCKGKGLAVYAVTNIKRGQRITDEAPLFTIPRKRGTSRIHEGNDSLRRYQDLSPENKIKFDGLHQASGISANVTANTRVRGEDPFDQLSTVRRVCSIISTNAFQLDQIEGEIYLSGIFEHASRFNHSCAPNAAHAWNPDSQRLTVHAMQDIEAGEEIYVSYFGENTLPEWQRQQLLRPYDIVCACPACDKNGKEFTVRSERRELLQRLDQDLKFLHSRIRPQLHLRAQGPLSVNALDPEGRPNHLGLLKRRCDLLVEEGLLNGELLMM